MSAEILGAITETLMGSRMGFVFKCMEIGEEEIKRAKLTKAQGSAAFKALCPSSPLRGKSLELYRAHAREICARIKKGSKLEPATNAELLAVFSDTSLVAPFHNTAHAAMEILFQSCFPTGSIQTGRHAVPHEQWPGAAREEIEKARKKFSQERGS